MHPPPSSAIADQQPHWLHRWGIDTVCATLVFVITCFVLHNQPHDRFHIDEAHKISETYYYHLFFERGDFKHPDWREDFYARINPPIAKYLQGATLSLQDEHVTDGHLQQRFEQLWQTPEVLRSEIPPHQLTAARRGAILFAAGGCAAVFCIGLLISGRFAGLIAAGFLLMHPLFLRYCSLALTDSLLLFFLSILVPLLIHVLRRRHLDATLSGGGIRVSLWHALLWEALLPAVILLCAAGTKLNGGLAAILWIVTIGIGSWTGSSGSLGKRSFATVRLALIPPVLAMGLFIALNPALYQDPIDSLLAMPRVYGDWMIKQAIEPGEAITSFSRRWSETCFHTAIRGEAPVRQISPAFPFSVLLWLALIGAGTIFHRLISGWKQIVPDPAALVVTLWIGVYGVGIVGWIPVDWDRYFLPLVPLQSVLAAVGACKLLQVMRLTFVVISRHRHETSSRREFVTAAGITGTALALSLGLAAVTDLSLISPSILRESGLTSQQVRACTQKGTDKHPEDPVRLMHLAEFLNGTGVPQAALPLAKRAVSHLPTEESTLSTEALRASFEYKLADIEARTGNYRAAQKELENSTRRIAAIRSRLTTHDPKVDREFQQLIDSRTELSKQLSSEMGR